MHRILFISKITSDVFFNAHKRLCKKDSNDLLFPLLMYNDEICFDSYGKLKLDPFSITFGTTIGFQYDILKGILGFQNLVALGACLDSPPFVVDDSPTSGVSVSVWFLIKVFNQQHYLPRRNYFEKMNMTIDHFDGQASTLDYIACASG